VNRIGISTSNDMPCHNTFDACSSLPVMVIQPHPQQIYPYYTISIEKNNQSAIS
jgi:hypothetical protein